MTTENFQFKVLATDGAARRGEISMPRGVVRTPAFMPVGTAGTVKAMYMDQVKELGADIILGNTYHLMLRPGAERVARLGGLHEFGGWKGPILTDSGGFQVMSLAQLRKLNEQGVTFRSHIDGAPYEMTPGRSIEIQGLLDSDIQMQLDECVALPSPEKNTERAMELSLRWAERCKAAFGEQAGKAMFGIVQGGDVARLRERSAEALKAMDLKGYSITGNRLAVGHYRNYYEAVSGDYIVKLQSVASDSLFRSGGNYFVGTHPKDDYVITGGGGWELDIHESNQYNGLTFDSFVGSVRRGSRFIHNGYYKVRKNTALGNKWLSDLVTLPSATGDYTSAVPASGETRQTIFGGLVFSTGQTFIAIPMAVTAGDLVSIDLLCHAPAAFTATSVQVYNNNQTVIVAKQGSVAFTAGPLAVCAFDFVAGSSASSLNFRVFGAPSTFGITGVSARNYGAHTNDGSAAKQIFPVCPPPKRA